MKRKDTSPQTMDETNPYASPIHGGMEASDSGPMAWRDGNVLLAEPKNAVLPRACMVSNRSWGVWRWRITVCHNWAAFVLLPLFVVPFVGLLCMAVGIWLLRLSGGVAEVRLCVRRPIALVLAICGESAVALTILANILTGVALIALEVLPLILGLVCQVVAFALSIVPQIVFTRLRTDLTDDGLVRVRGVHSGYLDRLPDRESSQESVCPQQPPQDE